MMRQLTVEEMRQGKVPRVEFAAVPRRRICIVLDGLESSSNLGNIFRMADALLIEKIWTCGKPPVLGSRFFKASRGTQRWVDWEYRDCAGSVLTGLKREGYSVVAMELCSSAIPLNEAVFQEPLALVFGSESKGISVPALEQCDAAVYLPMQGMGNSINVSNSVAVALFQVLRVDHSCRGE